MHRRTMLAVSVLIICVSMISSNTIAAQNDNVEVIVTLSDKYKNTWQNMAKNPKVKKILQKSKIYILYPGDLMSDEVKMHSFAANGILYMNSLLGKNEQFELVDKAYMAPTQEKRAAKMQDAQKRTMKYMRSIPESKQKEAISQSMVYNNRMWELLTSLARKLDANKFDALLNNETTGQLVFINGELESDYFSKLMGER